MRNLFIWLSIILFSGSALAGEPVRTDLDLFLDNNNVWTISFKDGREAKLYMTENPTVRAELPMSLLENTCNPELTAPKCKFKYSYSAQTMAFVWTKHSDPTKLFKEIVRHLPNQNAREAFPLEVYADIVAGSSDNKLICDQYDWVPNKSENNFMVDVINSEDMVLNTELGAPENKVFAGRYDVSFNKTEEGFQFFDGKRFALFAGASFQTYIARLLSFHFYKQLAQPCQVSFATDSFQAAQVTLGAIFNPNRKYTQTVQATFSGLGYFNDNHLYKGGEKKLRMFDYD